MGFRVSKPKPAFVTVTTVWVSVLFTRLFPKLKDVALSEAAVVGAAMCKEAVALCESEPEDPVIVTLAVPGEALEDAVMVTCPRELAGVRERDDGVAVTPAGSDPIATAMGPSKPSVREVATVRVRPGPPGTTLTVEGAT